jgi:hypothetical protein
VSDTAQGELKVERVSAPGARRGTTAAGSRPNTCTAAEINIGRRWDPVSCFSR